MLIGKAGRLMLQIKALPGFTRRFILIWPEKPALNIAIKLFLPVHLVFV